MAYETGGAVLLDFHKEAVVPQFVFTDWDSTIAATSMPSFVEVCDATGLPAEQVQEAHRAAKDPDANIVGSFQPYYALQDALGVPRGTSIPAFDEAYKEIVGDRHMYDDSGALFARLDEADMPHGVLTYGPQEWQHPKIRGSGYTGHIEAMPHTHKDDYVDELWDPADGTWKFRTVVDGVDCGLLVAESVVVIEDKGVNVAKMVKTGDAFVLDRKNKEAGKWPEEQRILTLDELQVVNGRLVKEKVITASARLALPQNSVHYIPVRSQFHSAA
jgi:hypothetical protein